MSEQGSEDKQVAERMDTLLLRLFLNASSIAHRAAEAVRRAKGKKKATRIRGKRASGRKPREISLI